MRINDTNVGEASIAIASASTDVFKFVSTPENDPLWVHACRSIYRLDDGPIRIGMRLIEQAQFSGVRMSYEWEVTRLNIGRSITYTSRRGLFPMIITIAVTGASREATVTQRIRIELPWFFPLRALLAATIGRKEAGRNLATLKKCLEEAKKGP